MTVEIEKNIKHQCAEYAYKCIEDIIKNLSSKQKEYRSQVRSTGAKIYGSGLMQTLAFYCSKMEKEPHFKKLSLHILKWILKDEAIDGITVDASKWDDDEDGVLNLFSKLLEKSDEEMIRYTQMALDITSWLARFADAKLEK